MGLVTKKQKDVLLLQYFPVVLIWNICISLLTVLFPLIYFVSVGRIMFQLFSDICPKTCKNFLCLCSGEWRFSLFSVRLLATWAALWKGNFHKNIIVCEVNFIAKMLLLFHMKWRKHFLRGQEEKNHL